MTHIMSNRFHACDSLEHITYVIGFDWLYSMLRSDSYKASDRSHAMTHL